MQVDVGVHRVWGSCLGLHALGYLGTAKLE